MARILVVDDDHDLRITIGLMLRSVGHKVIEAANRAGVDALDGHHFDILLTDMVISGTSGLEVMDVIRKRQPDIKIIAMSGDEQIHGVGLFENILEFGAHGFICKPFKREQLRAVIEACLKG